MSQELFDGCLSAFKILFFRYCFCEILTGRNQKRGLKQPGKCGEAQNLCQCHQYWQSKKVANSIDFLEMYSFERNESIFALRYLICEILS